MKKLFFVMALFFLLVPSLMVGETIINNNTTNMNPGTPNQPQNSSGCSQNTSTSTNNVAPGVYKQQNADGSSQTNYTTGTKQPYSADINCNSQPVPQPYVYTQPPAPMPHK